MEEQWRSDGIEKRRGWNKSPDERGGKPGLPDQTGGYIGRSLGG